MPESIKKIGASLAAVLAFIQNHFKAVLLVLFLIWFFLPTGEEDLSSHNLQKIALTGPIFNAEQIVEQIDDAAANPDVLGVLFCIDSPGGAVAPSIEIAYALKRLRDSKPVVVYTGGIMASGGYYSAIWGNEIIANPGSMIGSIGVIMEGADLSGLMEKVGVKTQVVHAGTYKQVGTLDRQWTAEERAELEKVIRGTYELFVSDVAKARNLENAQSSTYADAHIFTAAQALEVGLIDRIGVESDARDRIAELSGVTDPVWNRPDPFEKFLKAFAIEGSALLHTYFPALILK